MLGKKRGKQLRFKVPSVQIELIISNIRWFNFNSSSIVVRKLYILKGTVQECTIEYFMHTSIARLATYFCSKECLSYLANQRNKSDLEQLCRGHGSLIPNE